MGLKTAAGLEPHIWRDKYEIMYGILDVERNWNNRRILILLLTVYFVLFLYGMWLKNNEGGFRLNKRRAILYCTYREDIYCLF
jgi:hypothetical protein